ncbi:MAG TPA: rod shape-determining protein RodA [Candidatus Dependentiae bacterium]|nr:rod shape-determining protein RodA [Candidatus Dependentiae bacterium]HRQ62410.1 rod shape-determining protein RodA [Candidatus Dependentiae bacterium]
MFSVEQRIFKYFDWVYFILILALASIGLLFVFSATYTTITPISIYFKKQLFGIISGIIIYFLCCLIDYRTLLRWGYFGYVGVIGLLLFTLVKGSIGMGAQRWISVGFIKLQPSELAKLFFPAFAAYHIHTEYGPNKRSWYTYLPILGMLGLSFVLILKQPDLGTALIIAFTGLVMLWLAGIDKKFFIIGFFVSAIAMPIVWKFILKPYQKNRIAVFMGYGSSHKERYQIEQAAIAIGSGGIQGKGLLRGTQNQLQFLPESRTDFIFAVLCEEWGFVGALCVLILFALLFWRMFLTILTFHDADIQLFAIGIVLHIILSVIINVGMVIGLLPIVGIPLPLMSYGLSNLWITFASLGWFSRIAMQQKYLEEYVSVTY